MTTTRTGQHGRRLDLLESMFRPASCSWGGAVCVRAFVVADQSAAPLVPRRCPACHRPTAVTVVEVVGCNVERI